MKRRLHQPKVRYGPQQHKNFGGALGAFFALECPQLGGHLTRQTLVKAITNLVHLFYPETTHLRQGQIQWTTVDRNEKGSYRKTIQETKLTSVTLDLVRPDDAHQLATGKSLRELKKEAVARLFQQAWHQGGCLTSAEISILLKISDPTVGKYIREYEQEHKRLLPRRGTMHDMGPSVTHKVEIIRKLFLEGKTVEQTMRETNHGAEAVHRYIQAFKQILLCHRRNLNVGEIAYATNMSRSLVEEYLQLLQTFAKENIAVDQLLKSWESKAKT